MKMTTKDTDDRIPLNEIKAGQTVRIVAINAGDGLKNRLAAMGLLANVEIDVVRNDRAAQIIVKVKNSKVILGRGMSHKVDVVRT